MIAPLAKLISTKRIATALLLLVAALCNTFGVDIESGPKSIPELQAAI
jgi:predicted small secreted protein